MLWPLYLASLHPEPAAVARLFVAALQHNGRIGRGMGVAADGDARIEVVEPLHAVVRSVLRWVTPFGPGASSLMNCWVAFASQNREGGCSGAL